MSIRTRSTATLVARLQELRREEEEIMTELRQRSSENEPEDDDEDGDEETTEANEPEQRAGNQRTISDTREAERCRLAFMENQEAPNWQL